MVGGTGIEPVTPSMSTRCSPAELTALLRFERLFQFAEVNWNIGPSYIWIAARTQGLVKTVFAFCCAKTKRGY